MGAADGPWPIVDPQRPVHFRSCWAGPYAERALPANGGCRASASSSQASAFLIRDAYQSGMPLRGSRGVPSREGRAWPVMSRLGCSAGGRRARAELRPRAGRPPASGVGSKIRTWRSARARRAPDPMTPSPSGLPYPDPGGAIPYGRRQGRSRDHHVTTPRRWMQRLRGSGGTRSGESPAGAGLRSSHGDAPNGIRTRAAALKGRCPGPLDDGGGPDRKRARDGDAPSRAPVAEEVWPRGVLRLPLAAAARRGDAPSYCHLHSHYAIGPPPFRGARTVASPSAVGQAGPDAGRGRCAPVPPMARGTRAEDGPCRRPSGTAR